MADYNCVERGHVWLETDGTPYTRHRGRNQANVPVVCRHCFAVTELEATARHTAPPQVMPPAVVVENGDLVATLIHLRDLDNAGPVPTPP